MQRIAAYRLLWTLGLLLCAAPVALAQRGGEFLSETPLPRSYADSMTQADAAYTAKRYGAALDLYEHAHGLEPSEKLPLLGIARAASMLDDPLHAMRVLDELRGPQLTNLDKAELAEVNRLVERSRAAIAEITFDIMPRGATLYVNARPTPHSASAPVRLLPGSYAIEVEAPEHRRLEQMLQVRRGDQRELRLELLPMTNTSAETTRLVDSALPPNRVTRTVGGHFWTWIALGATGVFFGGAGLFHALAENEREELLWSCRFRQCDLAGAVAQLDDSPGDPFETVSKVSLALGVVAAAATVVLFIVEYPREVEVTSFLRPGPDGMRLQASF
jgi:hypothetical protein